MPLLLFFLSLIKGSTIFSNCCRLDAKRNVGIAALNIGVPQWLVPSLQE